MNTKIFYLLLVILISSGLASAQETPPEENEKNEEEILGPYYFVDTAYGKDFIKLLHIRREGDKHFVKELEIDTSLTLDSHWEHLESNNSKLIPTDSHKNAVYILIRNNGIKTIEEFGILVVNHFINLYPWIVRSAVSIQEVNWERHVQDGKPHNHVFVSTGIADRFTNVVLHRGGLPQVESGVKNFRVMKTTQSGFEDFYKDEYTTLPYIKDRVFSTMVTAKWSYSDLTALNYDKTWHTVKETFLEQFGGPADTGVYSSSVQNTIYTTERKVLETISQISKIEIELPNNHYIPFDFSKFPNLTTPDGNDKDVLIKTDAPAGRIRVVLGRKTESPKK